MALPPVETSQAITEGLNPISTLILMSDEEIKEITGGYTQQSKQVEELRRQGFWRARRAKVTGGVILERFHYLAVCAGAEGTLAALRKPREKRVHD